MSHEQTKSSRDEKTKSKDGFTTASVIEDISADDFATQSKAIIRQRDIDEQNQEQQAFIVRRRRVASGFSKGTHNHVDLIQQANASHHADTNIFNVQFDRNIE